MENDFQSWMCFVIGWRFQYYHLGLNFNLVIFSFLCSGVFKLVLLSSVSCLLFTPFHGRGSQCPTLFTWNPRTVVPLRQLEFAHCWLVFIGASRTRHSETECNHWSWCVWLHPSLFEGQWSLVVITCWLIRWMQSLELPRWEADALTTLRHQMDIFWG